MALFKNAYPAPDRTALAEAGAHHLTERHFGGFATGRTVLDEATAPPIVPLIDGPSVSNRSATRAADKPVTVAATAQQKLRTAPDHTHRLNAAVTDALVLSEMIDATKAFERAAQRLASALDGSRGETTHMAPLIAASLRVTTAGVVAEATGVIDQIKAFGEMALPR